MALPDLPEIFPGAVDRLMTYDWPGNVRELENIIEREIIANQGNPITFDHLQGPPTPPLAAAPAKCGPLKLEEVIMDHITTVLRMTKGQVEGAGGAAEILDVNPRTLQSRMKKNGHTLWAKGQGHLWLKCSAHYDYFFNRHFASVL